MPDGYGNSYFWVKPPRIVPADLVRTVGGRLDHTGAEVRPFDEERRVRGGAVVPRPRASTAIGVCFLHSYANPAHERRMREVLRREHPDAVVSLSLRGAARVPRVRAVGDHAGRRRGQADDRPRTSPRIASGCRARPTSPFYVMKSATAACCRADEVVHQPITTVLSGPAAGALGAALIARARPGFDRVLTCDGGGTSTDVAVVLDGEPTLTTEGTRRRATRARSR